MQTNHKFSNLFYRRFIQPISKDDDSRRHEEVLNIIVTGLGAVSIIAFLIPAITWFTQPEIDNHLSSIVSGGIFMVAMFGLHRLSRRGHSRLATYILVSLMGLTVTELTLLWSFELPIAELTYALTIVTAGVLLNTRAALIMTALVSLTVFGISLAEINHLIYARTDWADQPFVLGDAIAYLIIFSMTGLTAWLGNRQIDRSLQAARASEKALAIQRDHLEVMVIDRTKKLESEQLTRLLEVQRFAEFGRISAGLMHDVANPLTAISLNLDQLQNNTQSVLLTKARDSLKYLERYLNAARKQLKLQDTVTSFSTVDELQQVMSILEHKAKEAQVTLQFMATEDVQLDGDAVKFSQLCANLISNAIEAYPAAQHAKKVVDITIKKQAAKVILTVSDTGTGVAKKDQATIFEPFYTTKSGIGRGIGIGLVIVKEYVEQDFNGSISLQSSAQGTTFTVELRGARPANT
jgi:signal transduction histidine kinase